MMMIKVREPILSASRPAQTYNSPECIQPAKGQARGQLCTMIRFPTSNQRAVDSLGGSMTCLADRLPTLSLSRLALRKDRHKRRLPPIQQDSHRQLQKQLIINQITKASLQISKLPIFSFSLR